MSDLIIQIEILQNLLISAATGGNSDNEEFQKLRKIVLENQNIQKLVPRYIRTCRDLTQFWQFIKYEYASYAERRLFGNHFSLYWKNLS